ncbi:VOC family protein [Amycolatopsis sp. NPDC059027]|uniref:VOC family protein n=1 Tax=unclassified Amycolatopsis TaxID=2618356 RepID=UPI0036706E7D
MPEGITTIIYPVKDLAKAKERFSGLLGAPPEMDEPYYVSFTAGGLHIGLNPHGHAQGMTMPVGYYRVDDLKSSLQELLDGGAQPQQDVKDVGGGKLVASVTDADGNAIGLIQEP